MWPFTSPQYYRPLKALNAEYDFVVIGGGNAGCVLARRLSEDTANTVLLVERGDADNSWLHRTPLTSLHHWSDGKHSDVFNSAVDEQLGRSACFITGLGLGGSTRINGGQYTCGAPAEFNAWSQQGRIGWSYTDLKPYFDKSETWIGPEPREYHGCKGPLRVRSYEGYHYKSSERAANAAEGMSFPSINDMHSQAELSIGWNKMQFTIDASGRRQSAFLAYLPEEILSSRSDHLHVCTGALARKLTFSKGNDGSLRVQGVEIQDANANGPYLTVRARQEVVLCCGALRTPQLLLLSGVGSRKHLNGMNIDVVLDSSGVGECLQDHLLVPTSYNCPLSDSLWAMVRRPTVLIRELYNYIRHGTGWFLSTLVEVEIFGHSSLVAHDGRLLRMESKHEDSSNPENLPNFTVMAVPIADPRGEGIDKSQGFFGLNAALIKATSLGRLRLRSRDARETPLCEMWYLSTEEDRIALRAALRVTMELARTMRAAGYPLKDIHVPNSFDDGDLDDYIKQKADSMYHYSSSCRMAPFDDALPGVVDDELKVHGIANLRIADASIFPTVPATHPQALVYAIAEKCADMILNSKTDQSPPRT